MIRSSSARIARQSASTAPTQAKSSREKTGLSPTRENLAKHHSAISRKDATALPINPVGGMSSLPLTFPRLTASSLRPVKGPRLPRRCTAPDREIHRPPFPWHRTDQLGGLQLIGARAVENPCRLLLEVGRR